MTEAVARVIRGHYDHHQPKGRRTILWVALDPDEGAALLAALGPKPHRSGSIAIALAIGSAAETVATILAEERVAQPGPRVEPDDGPPEVPEPFDLGASVVRIAALTVRISLLTDSAGATPDLALRALGLESRDQVAADLAREQEALTRAFRDLRSRP